MKYFIALVLLVGAAVIEGWSDVDFSQHKAWLKVETLASPEYCPFRAEMGDNLKIHFRLFLNDENGEEIKTGYQSNGGKLLAFTMGSQAVSLSINIINFLV